VYWWLFFTQIVLLSLRCSKTWNDRVFLQFQQNKKSIFRVITRSKRLNLGFTFFYFKERLIYRFNPVNAALAREYCKPNKTDYCIQNKNSIKQKKFDPTKPKKWSTFSGKSPFQPNQKIGDRRIRFEIHFVDIIMRIPLDLDEHFVLTSKKMTPVSQIQNTNISQQQIYGISVDAKSHNLLQSFFQLPICFLFHIFPTFPAISPFVEITPVHVPQSQPECFNVPAGIAWLVQQSFFQGVLAPETRNNPLWSRNSPLQHTVSCGFEFLDFCCFFVRVSMVYWKIIFFSSHFFQCFPWVSLLTWFSPNKFHFLVVVIFMIPVIIFTTHPPPKPPIFNPLFVLVSSIDSPAELGES